MIDMGGRVGVRKIRVLCGGFDFFFFFKQKTAYEMRISDWSSDVCSSDLSCKLSGTQSGLPLPAQHAFLKQGAEVTAAIGYDQHGDKCVIRQVNHAIRR